MAVVAVEGEGLMLAQLLYVAVCLTGIAAIFSLQRHRHRNAKGCRWWLYSLLSAGLALDALLAWHTGAPPLLSSRWLIALGISGVMAWSAIEDWQRDRRA